MVATDYALLEYRQDLEIMFFRWKTSTSAVQIRDGYNLLLNSAIQENVNCWLIDTRRRGPANAEDENWFFTEFLAKLNSQLAEKVFIAVLATPDHYEHIRTKIGFEKVNEFLKGTLVSMQFFNSEQDAVTWLQQQNI